MTTLITTGAGILTLGLTILAAFKKTPNKEVNKTPQTPKEEDLIPTTNTIENQANKNVTSSCNQCDQVEPVEAKDENDELKGYYYNGTEVSIPIYRSVKYSELLGFQPSFEIAKVPATVFIGQATTKSRGDYIQLWSNIDNTKYLFWVDAKKLMNSLTYNPNFEKSELLKKAIINNY